MIAESIKTHAFRLIPGQDLREEVEAYVRKENIQAGCILTCVGSLTDFNIRFAKQSTGTKGSGHFEIIYLSGTISIYGCHLHIGISNEEGKMIGGHLLAGNLIYTTAEIIIGEFLTMIFKREPDAITGWNEIRIRGLSESGFTEF